jgi:tetratricopeptide (TPR) repeat protein
VPDFQQLAGIMKSIGVNLDVDTSRENSAACDAFGKGLIDECERILRSILEAGRTPERLNNLGFCLTHQKKLAEARATLEETLQLVRDPLYLNNLAITAYLEGNVEESKALLEEALKKLGKHQWNSDIAFMNVIPLPSEAELIVFSDVLVGVGLCYSAWHAGIITEYEFIDRLHKNLPKDKFDHYRAIENISRWQPQISSAISN